MLNTIILMLWWNITDMLKNNMDNIEMHHPFIVHIIAMDHMYHWHWSVSCHLYAYYYNLLHGGKYDGQWKHKWQKNEKLKQ